MKILHKFLIFSLFIGIALSSITSCGKKEKSTLPFIKTEGLIWNTAYHITYQSSENLDDSIRAVLDRVGKSLSVFDSTSLVSKVNRQDSTPVNTDFIKVYVMSRRINKISTGAFDPTLAPLIRAWGFEKEHRPSVDTLLIDSLMNHVGIAKTHLYHDALIKDVSGIEFNFSAIAKGYGCDEIGEMFKRNNVTNYLVEIGGEIAASGYNPQGTDWHVSIDKPIIDSTSSKHEAQEIIAFSNMGMATSGNYRNFHTVNNHQFGHIISARTGRPAETEIVSATVLANTAMEADALATTFMSMSKSEALELAKKSRLPIFLIFNNYDVWQSDKFKELIIDN